MIMNLTMKHFILTLALLLSVAAAFAQPARRGAPKINDDLSVSFQVMAPQAREVGVDICGKVYPMVREGEGPWRVTTDPLEPGFHYYFLVVDGFRASPASTISAPERTPAPSTFPRRAWISIWTRTCRGATCAWSATGPRP